MQLLKADELPGFYAPAAVMQVTDVSRFLDRANAYCLSVIGGIPPVLPWDIDQHNLKSIVAQCFEIMAEGETAQTDPVNGNITEAAPTAAGKKTDPLLVVDKMLLPYKLAYDDSMTPNDQADGWMFLGG